MDHHLIAEFKAGIENNDIAAVANLLNQNDSYRKYLDEGICSGSKPPLAASRSTEMVDLLLKHGASVAKVGKWWAPGFGTDEVLPEVGEYLIQRWETNQNIEAVRLMLDLGFPVDVPEHNHGYTPLHNAAWCGNAELVELLIARGHPLDIKDPQFGATPIGWACYSCLEAKRHPEEKFPPVVDLLLQAGASFDKKNYPTGHEGIDVVLKRYLGN